MKDIHGKTFNGGITAGAGFTDFDRRDMEK